MDWGVRALPFNFTLIHSDGAIHPSVRGSARRTMRQTTDYQAKYFAYALTREGGQGVERLQQSLLNATVDLNPHQVESALFAHVLKGMDNVKDF